MKARVAGVERHAQEQDRQDQVNHSVCPCSARAATTIYGHTNTMTASKPMAILLPRAGRTPDEPSSIPTRPRGGRFHSQVARKP